MTRIALVLISIAYVFTISGCGTEATPAVRQRFEMQKIDLPEGSVYVEVDSVETRTKCTPVVLEVSKVLRGVIGFYEYQVDEYNKADNNESHK